MRNLVKYVGIGLLVVGLAACDNSDTKTPAQGASAESNATGQPVNLMELMPGDVGKVETPIWDEYAKLVSAADPRGENAVGHIERFAFYEEAKKAYAIIATGESALYANVMLQKGVVI